MEYTQFKAATVDDAITEASLNLGVPSTELVYNVIDEGSSGFLGIGKKPAIIEARVRLEGEEEQKEDSLDSQKEEKSKFKVEVKEEQVKVDTYSGKVSINKKPEKSQTKVYKEKTDYKNDKPEEVKDNTYVEERKERVIVTPENIDEIIKNTEKFLNDLFSAMKIETKVDIEFDKEKNDINIDLSGEEMGVLIGKRGNTLDSLQYLTSL